MTAPALLLATSGVAALLALVLSFVSDGRLARRLAIASLWLALAAVPCSIAWDVVVPASNAVDASSKATMLGLALSHAMSYGAVIVPFAGIAMIALRRVSIANGKRRPRV